MVTKFHLYILIVLLHAIYVNTLIKEKVYKNAGGSVMIICLLDDKVTKDTMIAWFKDGKQFSLEFDNKHFEIRKENEFKVTLGIKSVQKEDAGKYNCFTNQKYGNKETELIITRPPVIQNDKNVFSVVSGEKLSVSCVADGIPIPNVFWYNQSYDHSQQDRGKFPTNESQRIYQQVGPGNSSLVLKSVSIDDAGSYFCIAENGLDKYAERVVELNVRLDMTVQSQPQVFTTLGSITELIFNLSGNPPPAYHAWESNSFSGSILPNCQSLSSEKYCERVISTHNQPQIVYKQLVLRIKEVQISDLGYYRLSIGDNLYGPHKVYNSTNLLVKLQDNCIKNISQRISISPLSVLIIFSILTTSTFLRIVVY